MSDSEYASNAVWISLEEAASEMVDKAKRYAVMGHALAPTHIMVTENDLIHMREEDRSVYLIAFATGQSIYVYVNHVEMPKGYEGFSFVPVAKDLPLEEAMDYVRTLLRMKERIPYAP